MKQLTDFAYRRFPNDDCLICCEDFQLELEMRSEDAYTVVRAEDGNRNYSISKKNKKINKSMKQLGRSPVTFTTATAESCNHLKICLEAISKNQIGFTGEASPLLFIKRLCGIAAVPGPNCCARQF
jgi:hypothetical protein